MENRISYVNERLPAIGHGHQELGQSSSAYLDDSNELLRVINTVSNNKCSEYQFTELNHLTQQFSPLQRFSMF